MLSWDEAKRQTNLRAHGLDFAGCDAVLDHPALVAEDTRADYGERRFNLLGWLRGQVVHLTYTERGDDFHVISLRRATRHEIRRYFATLSPDA